MTISNIPYINLHSHSNASIFDALSLPDAHIDFAISNGMNAMAITDHGNMNNLAHQVIYSKKINEKEKKFQPIFGIEAYFHPSIEEWKTLKESVKNEKDNK